MEEITEITREGITRLHARLTVHEFLLEILYGQKWATGSADEAQQARNKIMDLIRRGARYPQGIPPQHDADALQTEVIAVAENLLEKVLSQADEIRRQLQDP